MNREEEDLTPFFERLQAIPKFDDRGVKHYGECPCGGKITAIRSTYNGHLHAECDSCGWSLCE